MSISLSVLPVGLITVATGPLMAKVAEHKDGQVPQAIQVDSLIFGCFINISLLFSNTLSVTQKPAMIEL